MLILNKTIAQISTAKMCHLVSGSDKSTQCVYIFGSKYKCIPENDNRTKKEHLYSKVYMLSHSEFITPLNLTSVIKAYQYLLSKHYKQSVCMQYNRLLRGGKKSTCTFANLLFHIQTEQQSQPVKNVNNLIRQGITNNNHI